MDPYAPAKSYVQTVGRKPLLDTGLRAAGAGSLAYLAAKPLLNTIVRMAGQSKNPMLQGLVDKFVGGDVNKARRRLAMLGAGLGAASGLYSHADMGKGLQGFLGSLTDGEYWKRPENIIIDPSRPEEMLKMASGNYDDFFGDNIPTVGSAVTLGTDPFLNRDEKEFTSSLVLKAGDGRPKFSKQDLVKTAIQSGVDFGSAFLLGKGAGTLLALPRPVVNRLSTIGGIANAVRGSGMFG